MKAWIERDMALFAMDQLYHEDLKDYGAEIPEGFRSEHRDRAKEKLLMLPVKFDPPTGKWTEIVRDSGWYKCSACGELFSDKYDFCPGCGTRMMEVEDE